MMDDYLLTPRCATCGRAINAHAPDCFWVTGSVTPARTPWEDNAIQFPRLLAEIMATQDNLDADALCEAMDITREELDELFDRAQAAWETIKEKRR